MPKPGVVPRTVRDTFGRDEVVDATFDVNVYVNEICVNEGIKGDPKHCPVALSWKNQGVESLIYQTVSYIELPNRKTGDLTTYRFLTPKADSDQRQAFDSSGEMQAGLYSFKAPPEGSTLAHKAEVKRKSYENPENRAKMNEATKKWRDRKKKGKAKPYKPLERVFRNSA